MRMGRGAERGARRADEGRSSHSDLLLRARTRAYGTHTQYLLRTAAMRAGTQDHWGLLNILIGSTRMSCDQSASALAAEIPSLVCGRGITRKSTLIRPTGTFSRKREKGKTCSPACGRREKHALPLEEEVKYGAVSVRGIRAPNISLVTEEHSHTNDQRCLQATNAHIDARMLKMR
jgi:hypothetical protein